MLNTLLILQYSFLNGYLLHKLLLKEKDSSILEGVISSLFLSWCLNSLVIYLLVRLFEIPFTKGTTTIISLSLTLIIFTLGFFFHSDRSDPRTKRRNPLLNRS